MALWNKYFTKPVIPHMRQCEAKHQYGFMGT